MSRVPSRATSPAPTAAQPSSSSDLSSAWHAYAPSLPPPSPSSASRPRSRASSLIPSNRSQSLEFDTATRGGTLPSDTFSPEPDRPASPQPPSSHAGAMNSRNDARPRPVSSQGFHPSPSQQPVAQHPSHGYGARSHQPLAASQVQSGVEYDRPRTGSGPPSEQGWQYQHQHVPHQHERSSSRARYDSSPASPGASAAQPAFGQATQQQPAYIPVVNFPNTYGAPMPHTTDAYGRPIPPHPAHPPPADPLRSQYAAQQWYPQHQPHAHAHARVAPAQQSISAQAYTQAPATHPGWQLPNQAGQVVSPAAPQYTPQPAQQIPPTSVHHSPPHADTAGAPRPFPSTAQAGHIAGYVHPESGPPGLPSSTSTPNSRPLPQPTPGAPAPARSPSLPAQGPFQGAQALSSAPSVRRGLPQPPPGAAPAPPPPRVASGAALPRNGTLSRADSQRMAAEALMARGPPRRGRGALGSSATMGRAALLNAMNNDPQTPAAASPPQTFSAFPPPAMQSSNIASGNGTSQADLVESLSNVQIFPSDSAYAQPVPKRSQGDQSGMEPPIADQPARPASRGPRDDIRAGRERRLSSHGAITAEPVGPVLANPSSHASSPQHHDQTQLATAVNVPTIFSPPPDERPAVPTIDFGDGPPTSPIKPPSILIGVQEDEIPVRRASATKAPSIAIDALQTTTISVTPVAEDEEDTAPRIAVSGPNISISVADDEDDTGGPASAPKASISISHSGPLASPQRASAESAPTQSQHIGRAQPQAASAPTLGSGFACGACHKWIGGRVVSAMNQRFHPACFKCSHCSEALEHVAFYEHEGKAFCHFDYHELFSRRCFHCRTPIVDERFITISDPELVGSAGANGSVKGGATERSYHDLHFFCANCGDPFIDPKAAGSAAGADPQNLSFDENGNLRAGAREFVVWKGYPYCEKCHIQLHKPRCKGCRQPIVEGDVITALKAKWHPHCFVCEGCKRPFESPNFFIRGNKAYDEDCYKVMLRNEL
ncbi:hypothetical protein IE81DRAFT_365838 [Ceraceosorus guamensis]|uniref:LIM zinc-binding domain-containing protein n=1 Tax=Ceraceosorus guamensis TaxID=1522189 RepID=A0A316W116_9BASI|nr:hypothetical protein IE81DRAFT_365838 [Ceraceosorus guamensis]PWN43412.1 hypothetical protein IE81DRAFT_365838 [Ceraceosorus guamensis]